jgi:H/ACA ribonucleoprotein complex subunit 4
MSEFETDTPVKEKKKKKNKGEKDLGNIQKSSDFTVESSTIVAKLDSSKWPLLLKHFDRLNVRTNHYVPLPCGSSP